jgi:hypothetical protein
MKTLTNVLAIEPFTDTGLGCLTTLSTVYQLYRGGHMYWWSKMSMQRKPPTCRKSLTNIIT